MGYTLIEDFAAGVDLRKSLVTAKAGSLRTLSNGFVNAGGEIEKRRKLTLLGTCPAGQTSGIMGVNNTVYVFGLGSAPSLPTPVQYHKLNPSPALGGGVTISRILDTEIFQNKIYVVARFTDGTVRHFYDGNQVAGAGTNVRAYKSKIYSVDSQLVRFSAILDATNWSSGTGAGILDGTTEDAGAADFTGLETYYNNLALFGRRSIQIWTMDPDPAKNQIVSVLGNVGLVAPNGAAKYGNGDVLFLADTGVRSIRARDASNAAVVNDTGSPIDSLIRKRRLSMSASDADQIKALVDPLSGNFWLVWGSTIYILAYYPATKITAWSTYDLPFNADYVSQAGNRIAIRSGDNIYVYGAIYDYATAFDNYVPSLTEAAEYDATSCAFETPMLDMRQPATEKIFTGIDVACSGTWKIEACPDPNNPGTYVTVAVVSQPTYALARIPYEVTATHVQLRLTSLTTGPATVGAIALHYQGGDAS